jgi:acetyl esterase/lipase
MLDLQLDAMLRQARAAGLPDLADLAPVPCRGLFRQILAAADVPPADVEVSERDTGGVQPVMLRVYTPRTPGPHALVVYYHGGGYVLGDLDGYDNVCRQLCFDSGAVVVSVDYRLAPEHPFPAALEDALAAYRWLLQSHRPDDIVFSGESAGAGLAIAAAMALRDAGDPLPAGIVALSPFVDCALKGEAIHRRNGEDPIVEIDTLAYMVSSYFQTQSPTDPLVSPVYGDFRGLPPMLIQAGRREVLVDEAVQLAERAKAHGVEAALELYDERLHIFSLFPFLPNAARALSAVRSFVACHKP